MNNNKYIPYATREYVDLAKESVRLKDKATSYEYVLAIENGKLIALMSCVSIEYNGDPIQIEEGDEFDLSGIVINKVSQDGSVSVIEDMENVKVISDSERVAFDDTEVLIAYNEYGKEYVTSIPVNVIPFDPEVSLIDFNYTDNGDRTYTITGWKGTLNGETSTKMVLPNSSMVIL